MTVPCGRCIGCRLERSKQWAIRCVHEASLYTKNSFITLTYNDKHLPHSLNVEDFQKFMKRLRKANPKIKIRFFQCGEYGTVCKYCRKSENFCKCETFSPDLGRPHHHACIFNFDFPDKELWETRDGIKLYRSKKLEKLWPFGFSTIGEVTFESAAYVARYITKKINGEMAKNHYRKIDFETGEILSERKPEYITMSRRPGIAKDWIIKYLTDVYPEDNIIMRNGLKLKPPKYYDSIYDEIDHESLDKIKRKRKIEQNKREEDNSPKRLAQRKQVVQYKTKKLKRGLEHGTG